MYTIIFIDYEYQLLNAVYDYLISELKKHDVQAFVFNVWNEQCDLADLVILADAIEDHLIDNKLRVFGQRTVNRKTRLKIAIDVGSKVTPWITTTEKSRLLEFIKAHNQKCVVLKYDWSYAREGVSLLNIENESISIPEDYDPSKDIFMKFLDTNPSTYKAEYCFGQFLGGRITATPSFDHHEFREAVLPVKYWEPHEDLKEELGKLSMEFIKYGAAYISIDLMEDKEGDLLIIEINSNGVGRSIPWIEFQEKYKKAYLNALVSSLDKIKGYPKYADVHKDMTSVNFIQTFH